MMKYTSTVAGDSPVYIPRCFTNDAIKRIPRGSIIGVLTSSGVPFKEMVSTRFYRERKIGVQIGMVAGNEDLDYMIRVNPTYYLLTSPFKFFWELQDKNVLVVYRKGDYIKEATMFGKYSSCTILSSDLKKSTLEWFMTGKPKTIIGKEVFDGYNF